MITLNKDQREAVDKMHDFLKSDDQKLFMLEGMAGTGKTTCVMTLVNERSDLSFALTAPTNKATKVLRETGVREGTVGVDCLTIYSLLGLRVDKSSEVVRVLPLGESEAAKYDVIVVDESSMINEDLFGHINSAAKGLRTKIIFMGDPLQLPPVGEEHSLAFAVTLKASLMKVERHDNQILALAMDLRDAILEGRRPIFKSDHDENGGVFCVDGRKMVKQLERGYTSERYKDDSSSIKTIAWRNAVVNGYNETIREMLYKEESKNMFVKDERVVAAHPIPDMLDPINFLMTTDEEANVMNVKVDEHPMPTFKGIQIYDLDLETEFGSSWARGLVVHPDSSRAYSVLLDRLAKEAKEKRIPWSSFWEAKNTYLHDIRPCHAVTAHRSQGSSYDAVCVDVGDILLNRNRTEALKCLYVACTRARRILVLKTR